MNTSTKERQMCSQTTRSLGEDPVGSVPSWERCLGTELPGPWEADVTRSRHFPAVLNDALVGVEKNGPATRLQCILPDSEYSIPSFTRILLFSRQNRLFSEHERLEYLVPDEEAGKFAAELLRSPTPPIEYRVQDEGVRDVLVCTHGSRDACCATYGFPLYKALRERAEELGIRVWRTSHTGGHRFAPTLIDMPGGHYWAHLDINSLESVLGRKDDVATLRQHYRGWAGVSGAPAQAAEREVFLREGWKWLDYLKSAATTEADGRYEVSIEYASPDGSESGRYEVLVEQAGVVPLPNCMSEGAKGDVPQYRVAELRRV
ncbi:MAG: hypothetical protein O2854_06835 [Chloroflexi bacterium]|nr:hypothetical protein [Chloroflexota bacterium]